jgi:hypothetical protein
VEVLKYADWCFDDLKALGYLALRREKGYPRGALFPALLGGEMGTRGIFSRKVARERC